MSDTATEVRRLILRVDQELHAAINEGNDVGEAHKELHELAHAFEQHEVKSQ